VQIFPDHNPFLLFVEATAKGNGGHHIYQIKGDTVENVYEGYYNYEVKTYYSHQDHDVFKPNELQLSFEDLNNDGYNDIIFYGEQLVLVGISEQGNDFDGEIIDGEMVEFSVDNPAAINEIRYEFLYDEESGHFVSRDK